MGRQVRRGGKKDEGGFAKGKFYRRSTDIQRMPFKTRPRFISLFLLFLFLLFSFSFYFFYFYLSISFYLSTSPRLADNPGEAEVGYFDASLIGHEQIGNFQVPMNDVARVKILQSAENLEHDTFHLGFREGRSHVVQKRRDILFAIT